PAARRYEVGRRFHPAAAPAIGRRLAPPPGPQGWRSLPGPGFGFQSAWLTSVESPDQPAQGDFGGLFEQTESPIRRGSDVPGNGPDRLTRPVHPEYLTLLIG